MNDERNDYGFPIVSRTLEEAQAYAAEARERNKQPPLCPGCRVKEMEPAVINITQNWKQS